MLGRASAVAALALLLASLASFVALLPRSAAAAPATVSTDTELRIDPTWDAVVVLTVPAGGSVSVDGAPENGFYPVSYDGTTGWLPAASLVITKDDLPSTEFGTDWSAEAAVSPSPTVALPPATAAESFPTPSAIPPTAAPPVAAPPTTVPPTSVPATVVPETPTPVPTESAPTPTVAPSPTVLLTASPVVAAPTVVPAPPTEVPSPSPTATPSSSRTASTPVSGPATATVDLPLRAGPTDRDGLLFSVPAGSTVWRTGRLVDGWVSADFMGIVGWVQADLLAEPLAAAPEPTPAPSPTPDAAGVGGPSAPEPAFEAPDVPVSGPGSGTAYATGEVSLRSGPSGSYGSTATIPAGSPVVLTGVMENGFVRVDYEGQIGWVAFDLLSHPAAPTPATSPRGADSRRVYSREEIVRVIYAAADRYGQPRADMLRVAECESNLDPYAVNASGSYGLFQFISSTWESTPYADRNIFDPRANANAAAWMWSVGRRSEWVCK